MDAIEQAVWVLVAEHASDLVSVHAPNGDYLFASLNSDRLFGWPSTALVGRNAYELFHPDDVKRIASDHARHADGDDTHGIVQYRLRCADGHYVWVETRSEPHHVAGALHSIVCITRDIHVEREQRERADHAERALFRAERLVQIGDLARAVGQEINGLLGVALLVLDTSSDEGARDVRGEVREALVRIREVVGELRLLADHAPRAAASLDLAADVARVASLVLSGDLRMDTSVHGHFIVADRARVFQLLYNVMLPYARGGARVVQGVLAGLPDAVTLTLEGDVDGTVPPLRADLLGIMRETPLPPGPSLDLAAAIARELGVGLVVVHAGAALRVTLTFTHAAGGAGQRSSDLR